MASDYSRTLLRAAVTAAEEKAAEDPVALDVSEPLPFVDIFLLVTGSSERNVLAIADAIEESVQRAGAQTVKREGRQGARWILLDFGELVVHVFHEEDRQFYGLERLWRDCPLLPTERPETTSAHHSGVDNFLLAAP